jgi:hypothetical protein
MTINNKKSAVYSHSGKRKGIGQYNIIPLFLIFALFMLAVLVIPQAKAEPHYKYKFVYPAIYENEKIIFVHVYENQFRPATLQERLFNCPLAQNLNQYFKWKWKNGN